MKRRTILQLGLQWLVSQQDEVKQPPPPPNYLVTAIDNHNWDARKRGPLIAVLTDYINVEPLAKGYSGDIRDIAAHFGRKVATQGGLTILPPATMMVYNKRPGKPDLSQLTPSSALNQFLSSLSESQWKQLGNDGLGKGDLTEDQQAYWEQMFQVSPYAHLEKYQPPPPPPPPGTKPPPRKPLERVPISADFFAQARLHLLCKPMATLPVIRQGMPTTIRSPARDLGLEWKAYTRTTSGGDANRNRVLRVEFYSEVPEKEKTGDLDFARIEGTLSLSPGKLSIKSVLEAISAATGIEIYADQRIESLWVHSWCEENTRVPVGSLLRAIARSLAGTYRRVENLYILTEDLEGLGTRQFRLTQWQRKNAPPLSTTLWHQWAPHAKIAQPHGLSLSEVQKKRMLNGETVPVSELTREWLDRTVQGYGPEYALDPSRDASFILMAGFAVSVPNLGMVEVPTLAGGMSAVGYQRGTPETTAPVLLKPGSGVLLKAKSVEEAKQAVADVANRKLKNLFLDLDISEPTEFLPAVQAAGKAATEFGLSLRIIASALLEKEAKETPEALQDIDILGERGPWLDISFAESRKRIQARLKPIVDTPGIAGVALRDFRAPGYSVQTNEQAEIPGSSQANQMGYGYSLKNRLALIREAHIDPIDVGPTMKWQPPLFGRLDSDICQKWRMDLATAALRSLEKDLEKPIAWVSDFVIMPGKFPILSLDLHPAMAEDYDPKTMPPKSAALLAFLIREQNPELRPMFLDLTSVPAAEWKTVLNGVMGNK